MASAGMLAAVSATMEATQLMPTRRPRVLVEKQSNNKTFSGDFRQLRDFEIDVRCHSSLIGFSSRQEVSSVRECVSRSVRNQLDIYPEEDRDTLDKILKLVKKVYWDRRILGFLEQEFFLA